MRKWFALFAASIVAVAACGARTGLRVDERSADAGPEPIDAGPDTLDAADAAEEPDVVDPFPDVANFDCQDAGITYIYLISSENTLLRFYPPDLSLTPIGTIDCPSQSGGQPFSMAVDRQGVAYVVFGTGELFRVSTLTASCKSTDFIGEPGNFASTFGMGFSANTDDPGETLFIAAANDPNGTSSLGRIDPKTFDLTVVGSMNKNIGNPELTGTGDARLFAFGPEVPTSHLAEIDKLTAEVKSDTLINLNQKTIVAWAFAAWGGDFYFFTAEQTGLTAVHRYTPGETTTPPLVAEIGLTIVGAGVSTCAPVE